MNDDLEPVEPEEDILIAKPALDDEEDAELVVPGIDEPTPLSQLTKDDVDEDAVDPDDEEDEMEDLGADDWEV